MSRNYLINHGADLVLSYIAVLENEASEEEVAAFWAENPDILVPSEHPHKFERGMLFVKLAERTSNA